MARCGVASSRAGRRRCISGQCQVRGYTPLFNDAYRPSTYEAIADADARRHELSRGYQPDGRAGADYYTVIVLSIDADRSSK